MMWQMTPQLIKHRGHRRPGSAKVLPGHGVCVAHPSWCSCMCLPQHGHLAPCHDIASAHSVQAVAQGILHAGDVQWQHEPSMLQPCGRQQCAGGPTSTMPCKKCNICMPYISRQPSFISIHATLVMQNIMLHANISSHLQLGRSSSCTAAVMLCYARSASISYILTHQLHTSSMLLPSQAAAES